MDERLQKIMAQWGIASRRHAEEMIQAGRVRVNGNLAELGQKADPNCDQIEVDGKSIKPNYRPEPVYLLLHKPIGVVSTCLDPNGRPAVLDLLPRKMRVGQGIHPVGRLDVDSTGALLLTNDGELTFRLTHPRHLIPKTYQVWVAGNPSDSILQAWRQGVLLAGRKTLPAQVRCIQQNSDHQTLLEVILYEGRKRQIRRVAEQLGYPVIKLHRTAIGSIQLQPPEKSPLPEGQYRSLSAWEIEFLRNPISSPLVSVPVHPVDIKE
ncbi:putative pseudouridylate synthase [Planktothrix agardhii CCAP 1459/11A]|jgi:23S rRNA pseudouridine2605 synthase|uniref:Pseudouridine synthase n=1 Tax=Planktothrix agardhii CCAP 1459/11A TaxID=282420 RepID=A0A4P5ZIN3_PLAAG|nr:MULTISPECIES: pseudouridine synthase [Planktothrix]GDZ96006.1 putative pseudouridylate synthase [Planktothrix agardhii CCAP 1459/11A]CAD0226874.1 putative enzyme [Planktothrix agardhii]CAD5955833.1 putative RNA pseudouridine synthase slr0361 [Planktothrix rubescens]